MLHGMRRRISRSWLTAAAVAVTMAFRTASVADAPPLFPEAMSGDEIQLALQKLNVLCRVLYIAAGLLAVAAALRAGPAAAQAEVTVENCNVELADEAKLWPSEAGIIDEVKVHEGDRVEKNQVVLQLDDRKARAERPDHQQEPGRDQQHRAVKAVGGKIDHQR